MLTSEEDLGLQRCDAVLWGWVYVDVSRCCVMGWVMSTFRDAVSWGELCRRFEMLCHGVSYVDVSTDRSLFILKCKTFEQ